MWGTGRIRGWVGAGGPSCQCPRSSFQSFVVTQEHIILISLVARIRKPMFPDKNAIIFIIITYLLEDILPQ